MKAKLYYIDRKLGWEFAKEESLRVSMAEGYETCARYGVHLVPKKRGYKDWITGQGTGLIEELYPEILRQAQLDLANGRAKRYFCYIFYDFT